jgi:hypothetical protein
MFERIRVWSCLSPLSLNFRNDAIRLTTPLRTRVRRRYLTLLNPNLTQYLRSHYFFDDRISECLFAECLRSMQKVHRKVATVGNRNAEVINTSFILVEHLQFSFFNLFYPMVLHLFICFANAK